MADRHLNVFYSYNRDNELIENNLTRALIVTLELLSTSVRFLFLEALLAQDEVGKRAAELLTSGELGLALQGNIDKQYIHQLENRFLVSIVSGPEALREFNAAVVGLSESPTESRSNRHDGRTGTRTSVPDGWILNGDGSLVLLLEAKVGDYPLDFAQMKAHSDDWLGIRSSGEMLTHHVSLTWIDVLKAGRVAMDSETGGAELNQQEAQVLSAFQEFLGFYGYRLFEGIDLSQLLEPPRFRLEARQPFLPSVELLAPAPSFVLAGS